MSAIICMGVVSKDPVQQFVGRSQLIPCEISALITWEQLWGRTGRSRGRGIIATVDSSFRSIVNAILRRIHSHSHSRLYLALGSIHVGSRCSPIGSGAGVSSVGCSSRLE